MSEMMPVFGEDLDPSLEAVLRDLARTAGFSSYEAMAAHDDAHPDEIDLSSEIAVACAPANPGGTVYDLANGDGSGGAPAGLTPKGVRIYAALVRKGMKPKQALAMARNSQKTQPGEFHRFSNELDFAGDYDSAPSCVPPAGTAAALDAAQREQQLERFESRLTARDMARAGDFHHAAGVYLWAGTPNTPLHLSGQQARDITLANPDPSALTSLPNCGESDEYGYCASRYHEMGCGSQADSGTALQLMQAGAYERAASAPMLDDRARIFHDQYGDPVTLSGYIEASTGMRQSVGPFETGVGQPELTRIRRIQTFGDPESDSPAEGSYGIPSATQATAAAVRAQDQRLAARSADEIRGSARQEQAKRAASTAYGQRRPSRDDQWDMQTRRDAIKARMPSAARSMHAILNEAGVSAGIEQM